MSYVTSVSSHRACQGDANTCSSSFFTPSCVTTITSNHVKTPPKQTFSINLNNSFNKMHSFFTDAAMRRMAMASRAVAQAARFGTTYTPRKSVAESAKDTLKNVDRKVSDKLVDGINVGTKAAETLSGKATESSYKAAGTAEEIRQKMKQESEELAGKAKDTAKETEETVKDAAKKAEDKIKEKMGHSL